jgi:hypothetical protein
LVALLIETVSTQLQGLASVFRRKITTDMTLTYHKILAKHVDDESFIRACEYVLEHEALFPPPSLLLRLSRETSRNRGQIGEPFIRGVKPEMSLREYLEAVEGRGSLPARDDAFVDVLERLVYEETVETHPRKDDESSETYIGRLSAVAVNHLARLREKEQERKAGGNA